ncbi:hypothetical protein CKO28_12360 [Rhodovibrio sodomensis]|uniref:DNA-binding domain-containing protein n=1 Tax=Rhodovibrio sodomensis TaxID=1088 RepID=A0ABS1DG09_9PROT|nr:CbiX/SirB N-terminal domain-containing protein [Rhodovibrio sodomensis]MBK1668824.1 hypothetical protein [Rhodovibrio sodomensis]
MDIHENARLTSHGRALLVRRILAFGETPKAVATAFRVSTKTARKWGARFQDEGPAVALCAHGTRGAAGTVQDHARDLAQRHGHDLGEVGVCALYGAPRLEGWLDGLSGGSVRLVPFMMAEGYTFDRLRERVAAHANGRHVEITRPVGVHPDLGGLIAHSAQARCVAAGWRPEQTALLLVGHGTRKHAASTQTAEAHVAGLAEAGAFAEVATAYLDDDPSVGDALARLRAPACIAVGFFTDAGDHGRADVPELLADSPMPTVYAGPIGPDPVLQRIILDQFQAGAPD